jgi:hypothetical protein
VSSWVEDFVSYTDQLTSPRIFRQWAAISAIAGALERKTWVFTAGSRLYPNLYVILVGPPGVGKTEVTWRVQAFWRALPKHHVAHSSLTKAALIDNLAEATRNILRINENPAVISFNSLQVASDELGVLLPAWDTEFMAALTHLYDNKIYTEKRRTKDRTVEIKNPQLNLLAACTPSYLQETLPEGAWDQGFTSRLILVYSGEQQRRSLFDTRKENLEIDSALKDRLIEISDLYGEYRFTEEAMKAIDNWHMKGGPPRPDHPKLNYYNSRRTAHVLKLSMVAAAATSLELVIELEHIQMALDWLLEAELYMADIFKSMANTSHAKILEETWYFIFKIYNKEGKRAVASARVTAFVGQRVPAHSVQRVIEVLEQSGMIVKQLEKTGVAYVPRAKEE